MLSKLSNTVALKKKSLKNSCRPSAQSVLLVATVLTGLVVLGVCVWWFFLLTAFGESRLNSALLLSPFAIAATLLPIVVWVRAQKAAFSAKTGVA